MRLQSLMALAAAGALLLPLGAQAGTIAAEKKPVYMQQCVQQATQGGISEAQAKKHCECGEAALEKNFTDAELKNLDTAQRDPKLVQRAQQAVLAACPAPKK